MNPDLAYLLYILGAAGLAIIAIAIGAIGTRANIDVDEAEQERIEHEKLPIMLRRQAD